MRRMEIESALWMVRVNPMTDEVSTRLINGKLVVTVAFLGCCLAVVFALLTRGSFDAMTKSTAPGLPNVSHVVRGRFAAPRFFLPSSTGRSEYGPVTLRSVTILGFFDGCDAGCVSDIRELGKLIPSSPVRSAWVDLSGDSPSSSQLVTSLVSAKFPSSMRAWIEYGSDSSELLGTFKQYQKLAGRTDLNDSIFCIDGRGDVRLYADKLSPSVLSECASIASKGD